MLVEVTLERGEAALPEDDIRSQPSRELGEALSAKPVQAPLSRDAALHQPGLAQQAQMAGGVRLAEAGLARELADGTRPREHQVQERAAGGLGDDLEGARGHLYIFI